MRNEEKNVTASVDAAATVNVGELNRKITRGDSEGPRPLEINPEEEIDISPEYETIKTLLEKGCNAVFVTGNAGTGKSTLIKYLKNNLKKRMAIVAPTGVAALNAGGVTIHSFFLLPPRMHSDDDICLVHDRKLYEKLEILVIDEISMVRCDLLDSIDKFLKKNRQSQLPFGGVQLLLIGDLFQLPPVVKEYEMNILRAAGYSSPYFFSSFSLQQSSFVPVELKHNYRQSEQFFISLLNKLRTGEDINSVIKSFNAQCCAKKKVDADITLTCTNVLADKINLAELQRLTAEEHTFTGEIKGRFNIETDKLPSPFNLKLKVGARVMFTQNGAGWVNGSLGIVKYFDDDSIGVELVGGAGSVYNVKRVKWETYKYVYNADTGQIVTEKTGTYTQYPLMLSWAVTIHKSQGKTLDNVLVDLGYGAFASGQVYVALSRCRTIEGINLKRPLRISDVQCDPLIKHFHKILDEMKQLQSDKETIE